MTENDALPRPSEQYLRNCRWITANVNELDQTYATGWFAVDGERVLAAGPGLNEVTRLVEQTGASDEFVYEFIDDGSLIFSPSCQRS